MKHTLRIFLPLLIVAFTFGFYRGEETPPKKTNQEQDKVLIASNEAPKNHVVSALDDIIKTDALLAALEGLSKYADQIRHDRLIVIDFSKPSTEERFYVINPQTGELLFKKLVAHGQGSGLLHATAFSNEANSHQSSLGFFKTAETYSGKHGYSLRLDGLQPGLNDAARERAVVIHAADYVSESFIKQNGYLGRSWGCPALPADEYSEILADIQGGTLIFIYHPTLNLSVNQG